MSAKRGPKMSEPGHDEVHQFVQETSCPFVTTEEVSEHYDEVTSRTIRKRLRDLVDQNRLRSRRVGPHAIVWYLAPQWRDDDSRRSPSSVNQ